MRRHSLALPRAKNHTRATPSQGFHSKQEKRPVRGGGRSVSGRPVASRGLSGSIRKLDSMSCLAIPPIRSSNCWHTRSRQRSKLVVCKGEGRRKTSTLLSQERRGRRTTQAHVYDTPKSRVLQQQRVLSRYSSPCHSRLRRIYAQAGSLPNSLDRKWTSSSLYSLQYSPKVTKVC